MATEIDLGKVVGPQGPQGPPGSVDISAVMQYEVSSESVAIGSGQRSDLVVTFPKTFKAVPVVVATVYTSTGGGCELAVKNITKTGFTANIKNNGGSTAYFKVSYLAIGEVSE